MGELEGMMWETIKSVAFVLFTVMIALILQARADRLEPAMSHCGSSSAETESRPIFPVDAE